MNFLKSSTAVSLLTLAQIAFFAGLPAKALQKDRCPEIIRPEETAENGGKSVYHANKCGHIYIYLADKEAMMDYKDKVEEEKNATALNGSAVASGALLFIPEPLISKLAAAGFGGVTTFRIYQLQEVVRKLDHCIDSPNGANGWVDIRNGNIVDNIKYTCKFKK